MPSERRQTGNAAEDAALAFLEQAGYRLRARNFTCRYGELDLVVEKDEVLCFVEVRMRTSAVWGDPMATVSWAKQRRVVKAALHYLRAARIRQMALRFDVIAVIGRGAGAVVEHIPNAFDAGM